MTKADIYPTIRAPNTAKDHHHIDSVHNVNHQVPKHQIINTLYNAAPFEIHRNFQDCPSQKFNRRMFRYRVCRMYQENVDHDDATS